MSYPWEDKYVSERREGMFGCLRGRPLSAVTITDSRTALTFEFVDGSKEKYVMDDDCCSVTWIEYLEQPTDLRGAVITGFDEPEISEADAAQCTSKARCSAVAQVYLGQHAHDCVQYYRTVFHTDKGDIEVEYRNDSNGFYGGGMSRVVRP